MTLKGNILHQSLQHAVMTFWGSVLFSENYCYFRKLKLKDGLVQPKYIA